MYTALLVEDDPQIREIISDYFDEKGKGSWQLDTAKDGVQGLKKLQDQPYDLVFLDVMLPGMDGFEICRQIRRKQIIPIIFLTALGREEDILYGYSLGCDDYLVKPFSVSTLYAKAEALMKRVKGTVISTKICYRNLVLNLADCSVWVDDILCTLPTKEYELLKLFLENQGLVFDREMLISKIWGYDSEVTDRVVDNHIKNLRKQLKSAGGYIITKYKLGYVLPKEEK